MAYVRETNEASTTGGCRVFLVDDHPLIREGMRLHLEAEGHFLVVGEANSGEEALELLDTPFADVVVMDIQLPGINGVEATRRLKVRHPDLKVVIVTAFGQEYLMSSILAGADGYLVKTSGPRELARGLLQAAQGHCPVDVTVTRHLVDQAVSGAPRSNHLLLSPRQQDVLRLVGEGVSSKELASRLCISRTTLKREFRNIFDTLGVNDRAHAVAEAGRRRLF